jgi:hypothetical protein
VSCDVRYDKGYFVTGFLVSHYHLTDTKMSRATVVSSILLMDCCEWVGVGLNGLGDVWLGLGALAGLWARDRPPTGGVL